MIIDQSTAHRLASLGSKARWLRRLARHSSGSERAILEARRELASLTFLRLAFKGGVSL